MPKTTKVTVMIKSCVVWSLRIRMPKTTDMREDDGLGQQIRRPSGRAKQLCH